MCGLELVMKSKADRLYGLAESQQGYFTSGQAVVCGYPTSSHVYHMKTGSWLREGRGIYRLARFPASDDSQYVRWTLWSRNRQGVPRGIISHETALALFELSDLMPGRIHMTVPPGFRRNSAIPEVLVLHRRELAKSDVEVRQGYCVTRPLRAVADLLDDPAVSPGHLRQALNEGLERGLITRAEMEAHPQAKDMKHLLRKERS